MKAIAWRLVPTLVLAALLVASAPPWPDDWDGFGFLDSIARFDMERFSPHPPGYPVYVLLLRLAAVVCGDPMRAATLVSVASGMVVFGAVRSGTRGLGELASLGVAVAAVGNPLAFRALTGVGSEACALALTATACWGIGRAREGAEEHPGLVGGSIGLALGARLSWAPLLLPLLLLVSPGARPRALKVTALAVASWLVPLLALVGPAHLSAIYRAHLSGHAERWGGTALSDPRPIPRLATLARDVFVDGIGVDSDWLGIALGTLLLALAVVVWRRRGVPSAGQIALVCLPYALWIFVGQNLREQPRHALPLVVIGVVAVGVGAARAKAGPLFVPLVLLMLARTAHDAHDRRTMPPAGAQLAQWMDGKPDSVVFGGASVRYFSRTAIASRAVPAESQGDVEIALARMATLPAHRYATSEIEGVSGPVGATFCRPPRIDRKRPCLEVRALP